MPVARRTRAARADILSILIYIAKEGGIAASKNVAQRLDDAIDFLSQNPKAGPPRDELRIRLRSWPVENLVIFYRPLAGGVEITRVIHGARDLSKVFRRRK